VDDVSFGVGHGEIAALLGPNGSGKSTVMRILTGYFSPTAGRATVGGVDVGREAVWARRRVGYLPEQVALYPDLTVSRYLTFVAGVKGLDRAAARRAVGEVLARCFLVDVALRPTGTLSKGYRQRVGLAQALLHDPDVLILDEPTVGLDPVQTVEMRELIRGVGRGGGATGDRTAGRTVLLSTHILSEASALCSRIIILSRGHLLAEDTPAGLGARLSSFGRLTVSVDGPPQAVAAALAAVPGVSKVEARGGEGSGGASFLLLTPDPTRVQRQLAAAVVARGWALLELRAETPTLEDLFVRLIGAADTAH
jgi:ABC-2 type transport system ATP-binding protein